MLKLLAPGLLVAGAGVYMVRHYAAGGGSTRLVSEDLFAENWSQYTSDVLAKLRSFKCGEAFDPASAAPFDFDVLEKDESGGPLPPGRCGVAANPRKPDKNAWVYAVLVEAGRPRLVMASYADVKRRLRSWPDAALLASLRDVGGVVAGVEAAPGGFARGSFQSEGDAGAVAGEAPSAPGAEPEGPQNVRLGRLKPILSQINEEGSPFGVKVAMKDLIGSFETVERSLMLGSFEGLTPAELGLNPPASEPLEKGEPASKAYKCLVQGEWRYQDDLPVSADGGVTECRKLEQGVDSRGFDALVWHVYDQWSARRGQWSPYSDEEHAAAVDRVIALRYEAEPAVDPEKHSQELEKLFARLDRLRRGPSGSGAAAGAEAALKERLILPYRSRVKIEAARHVIERTTGQPQP